MSLPRISIITPCLNRARFIREAVESVLAQEYPNLEHIVVDGGSTDGTLAILQEYPHLRLTSEPDEGMYDAINKGLRLTQGEIIGLLNSDDLYAPSSLHRVAEVFSQHPQAQAVVGRAETFLDEEGERRVIYTKPTIQLEEFWFRVVEGSPVSNAWFFRRQVFDTIGRLNTTYRYVADREFLIRLGLAGIKPVPIHQVLYLYRSHQDSATLSTLDSRLPERGSLRMKILLEGIHMLESFLRDQRIPAEVRAHLRNAHSECCYKLTATALYHRRFAESLLAILRGWHHDGRWPLIFFRLLFSRVRQEFSRQASP